MPSASRSRAIFRWCAAACLLGPLAGCTSAISSAYLRNMPWDGPEHAAEPESTESDQSAIDDAPADEPAADEAVAGDGLDDGAEDATQRTATVELPPGPGREAAIEEAVARISRLGTLSAAAQDALVETLRHAQQQDWPVVIEEFAAALEANGGSAETTAVPEPAPPAPEPLPAADPAATEPEPAVAAEPAELGIDNACFATRVHGWGAVDRFPADAFRGGQELIVYFELDNLSCGTSAAGHTTCIDTALTLVDAEGQMLHRWTFEPVTETSPARRRDYFARYVLTLPDGLATGPCRLDIAVTDALSGGSVTTTLPLEITGD